MSYLFYKWIHLSSLLIIFLTTGAAIGYRLSSDGKKTKFSKGLGAIHGIFLLIAFTAGFGLLAKGGFQNPFSSVWLISKLAFWVALGALPAFLKRMSTDKLKIVLWLYGVFCIYIVYMVVNKPF